METTMNPVSCHWNVSQDAAAAENQSRRHLHWRRETLNRGGSQIMLSIKLVF
uniref:Uncharacterized protein n=1 Tax=Nelumbo nucifera TaxID=4432 RepID=A0A822YPY6_NELNU|nr:TPA_asm: hypothetical protein HUJ06_006874 [Nelumbo nucifera]